MAKITTCSQPGILLCWENACSDIALHDWSLVCCLVSVCCSPSTLFERSKICDHPPLCGSFLHLILYVNTCVTKLYVQLYVLLGYRCILIVPMSVFVQAKLQWLCEEVREREFREKRLRRTLQQHKWQIKALKQTKDSKMQSLLNHITLQDWLIKDIQSEKRGTNSPQRKVITRSVL